MASAAKTTPVRTRNRVAGNLWLGCFEFDEPGEEAAGGGAHNGSFQMIVYARGAAEAAELFEARILKLRAATTLLNRPVRIYLNHIIKLSGEYSEALLVNYISSLGAELPGSLYCAIPEQDDIEAEAYGEPDDGTVEPFLELAEESSPRNTPAKPSPKAPRGARKSANTRSRSERRGR